MGKAALFRTTVHAKIIAATARLLANASPT